jgi:hypothetical protein
MKLYKTLDEQGHSYHATSGQWALPVKNSDGTWTAGDWMTAGDGKIIPDRNGFSLYPEGDLVRWLGPVLYEAEYRGEKTECDHQIIVREARLLRRLDGWNERTMRLFACDCAERALSTWERANPNDDKPRRTIEIARRYADGQATQSELCAAWEAAWEVAWYVSRSRDISVWSAAAAAIWTVTDKGMWNCTWSAARATTGDADRGWQTDLLLKTLGERQDRATRRLPRPMLQPALWEGATP